MTADKLGLRLLTVMTTHQGDLIKDLPLLLEEPKVEHHTGVVKVRLQTVNFLPHHLLNLFCQIEQITYVTDNWRNYQQKLDHYML